METKKSVRENEKWVKGKKKKKQKKKKKKKKKKTARAPI
jgi:hypothetical protein